MKKWVLIILSTMLLFSVKNCYANDSNIIVDTYRNEKFVVEFSIGSEKVYGFTTTLDYDSSKFKLSNCTAHNDYEITTYQNNIVVESIKSQNNVKAATCYFEILDSKETDYKVKNINTGNYNEVKSSKDIEMKVLGNKTPTQVENIPDTAEGIGMAYILLGCAFTVCGGVIIFLLFNKKYSILCSLLIGIFLLIPGRVEAAKDKVNLSVDDLNGARYILLGKEESNLDYDFDGDEKITINDLVITKVDLNDLQVSFNVQGNKGETSYSNLSVGFKVNSTSDIKSLDYCLKLENDTCNYSNIKISTPQKNYYSSYFNFNSVGNLKRKMCVRVTNTKNVSREVCSSEYLVDSTKPTISFDTSVASEINGCENISSYISNNTSKFFKISFGFSGGRILNYNIIKQDGAVEFDSYSVQINVLGKNGLTSTSSRQIRCNKRIAFVGSNLTSTETNYTSYFSVSPMIKTEKLVQYLSPTKLNVIETANNDYVIVTALIDN